jgi:hypothetical protein
MLDPSSSSFDGTAGPDREFELLLWRAWPKSSVLEPENDPEPFVFEGKWKKGVEPLAIKLAGREKSSGGK